MGDVEWVQFPAYHECEWLPLSCGRSRDSYGQITNYELGIVFPLKDSKQADEIACWDRPPRKYDLAKDEPWVR